MSEREIFLAALDRGDPEARQTFLDHACAGDPVLRAKVDSLLKSHEEAGSFLLEPARADTEMGIGQHPLDESASLVTATSPADGGIGCPVEPRATEMFDANATEAGQATRESVPEMRPPLGFASAADGPSGTETTVENTVPDVRRCGFVAGQVIAGRYTLLEVLGEGGMGTVYRAEQTQPVKRQVALKVIKIGMDLRAVLNRFDAERQALALMDHPNIARVFDGGTTEAGQPFFVMELVKGPPITAYCDRHRLPVHARLELFVSVCQAVQHAHQKGIIHRDLKPSNVLVSEVDGRPAPKVIDFGVAKATEFTLTDQSLADAGAIVGTPTYMSPEQADPSSMDIDTRTDVYALGVILYELLAGSPPIDAKQFQRGAILEMLRMVREIDPPRPSTKVSTSDALPNIAACRAISPEHLARALTGDLDWVVMKALEKDRTRRYETANGLAADVLRHLAHEPVLAAPPSRLYRMRKFMRKHRGAVTAASIILLAMLAGIGGTSWGLIQAAKANSDLAAKNGELTVANGRVTTANAGLKAANARVEARYKLAVEAIRTFHTGVSSDFLFKEAKFKELRNRLLTSASDFYGKLGALLDKETDRASRLALAQSNYELAELTGMVGRNEDALAAHRAVLAAREALAAEPGTDAAAKFDVGRSLTAIANLLQSSGKTNEALATYRRAESLLDGVAGSDPWFRNEVAHTGKSLGLLLAATGKQADAEAEYRKALAIEQKLANDNPAVAAFLSNEAGSHINLGNLLMNTGRQADAEAEYRKTLAIDQKLVDGNPTVTSYRHSLAAGRYNLGNLLRNMDRPAEAEAEYRQALAIEQKLADDDPAVTAFRSLLAACHNGLGGLLWNRGKPAEAEVEYRQALAIQRKLAEENPAVTEFRSGLAVFDNNFGMLLSAMGESADAKAEYRKALAIEQKLADDNPSVTIYRSRLAVSHHNLGDLLKRTGKPADAEAEYREAVAIQQKLADDNPSITDFQNHLANTLLHLGRTREAVAPLVAASSANPNDTFLAMKVAALQAWFGQEQELADTCARALDFAKVTSDPMTAERAAKICCVSATQDKTRLEAALALARKSVELGKSSILLAWFQMTVGMVQYRLGHYPAADAALITAAITAKNTPKWDAIDVLMVEGTSALYRAMSQFRQGNEAEARKLAAEAATKMPPLPKDENNPLADDVSQDHLILWLAYKEAKALINFDAPPP
jgi:serine/threonine protein kinase/tetratricopeptide (TPR) repeat protein